MKKVGATNHSKYIRFMSLNGFIINRKEISFDSLINSFSKLEYELKAIGNNINQIARKLNSEEELLIDEFIELRHDKKQFRDESFNIL